MARMSDITARLWRRWEPTWWGNHDDPPEDRWFFMVHPLSSVERIDWQARLQRLGRPVLEQSRAMRDRGAGDSAEQVDGLLTVSRAASDGIIAALCERVRVRNLVGDDGVEVEDAAPLIRLASESQLAELRRVVEQGITDAEGKGYGPPSGA